MLKDAYRGFVCDHNFPYKGRVERVLELGRQYHEGENDGFYCYLCKFGDPDSANPHEFWIKFWKLMEDCKVNSEYIRHLLNLGGSNCETFGRHKFIELIADAPLKLKKALD